MKIVTWNCNGALRKKYLALEKFDADILVVQECEDPAQSSKAYAKWAGDYLWTGENKNKGIGVFSKRGLTLEILDWPDDSLRQFLPCRVNDSVNLLAVWTMQANSPTFQYIGQFWKYLQLNRDRLSDPNTVICGDFNSNVCWDKKNRHWNHCDVVRELEELDIHSMYHGLSGEPQGEETKPTLFMQRKLERPYHIDYAFVSKPLMKNGSIEVGHPEQWLEVSDHMPIVFSLSLPDELRADEARDLLRKTVWDVLPNYEGQYHYDGEDSGTDYTEIAIMELWKKGFSEGDDTRKMVLLLRTIMFHDRMNSEAGNFNYIDEHKSVVEKILKHIS